MILYSTLTTYFNIEVKQFNIINAFINTLKDLRSALVICFLLNGFKRPSIVVELDRALYRLKDSLVL
ncbi:hypothetical protein PZA11_006246 [Diplocarpon coronariae]